MRKLLLVVLIGLVLAINLYGFVNHVKVEEVDHIQETTTTVYME